MHSEQAQELTQLLKRWQDGSTPALAELTRTVQPELRRLARHYLRGERPGHMLESAALVNEAWLRLFDCQQITWQNRAHFFGVAAQLMRHVLVDEARQRNQQKRGGELFQVSLSVAGAQTVWNDDELLALNQALESLEAFDVRKCRIIELRYFGGLSLEEVAGALQLSTRTVQRELQLAQAWLYQTLKSTTAR